MTPSDLAQVGDLLGMRIFAEALCAWQGIGVVSWQGILAVAQRPAESQRGMFSDRLHCPARVLEDDEHHEPIRARGATTAFPPYRIDDPIDCARGRNPSPLLPVRSFFTSHRIWTASSDVASTADAMKASRQAGNGLEDRNPITVVPGIEVGAPPYRRH